MQSCMFDFFISPARELSCQNATDEYCELCPSNPHRTHIAIYEHAISLSPRNWQSEKTDSTSHILASDLSCKETSHFFRYFARMLSPSIEIVRIFRQS